MSVCLRVPKFFWLHSMFWGPQGGICAGAILTNSWDFLRTTQKEGAMARNSWAPGTLRGNDLG